MNMISSQSNIVNVCSDLFLQLEDADAFDDIVFGNNKIDTAAVEGDPVSICIYHLLIKFLSQTMHEVKIEHELSGDQSCASDLLP